MYSYETKEIKLQNILFHNEREEFIFEGVRIYCYDSLDRVIRFITESFTEEERLFLYAIKYAKGGATLYWIEPINRMPSTQDMANEMYHSEQRAADCGCDLWSINNVIIRL